MVVSCQCEHTRSAAKVNDSEWSGTIVIGDKVVENLDELDLVLEHADRIGVRPVIGLRVNLDTQGVGRWAGSSGIRAKFGLTFSETLRAIPGLALGPRRKLHEAITELRDGGVT